MDCEHNEVTVTLDFKKEIQSIKCECGYILSVPEFRKRKFKIVNVLEPK